MDELISMRTDSYLLTLTGLGLCLLLNFGNPRLEIGRLAGDP